MPNIHLALNQEKMTLDVEGGGLTRPVFGCGFFPRRRSSEESSATNSSYEESSTIRIVHSPRASGFPCNALPPGITVSASSPTPSPSPNHTESQLCPVSVHHSNGTNMLLQRSPSSHAGRSIRRNTSGTRLGPTSPNLGTKSSGGVSRSQSLRTPRSRPSSHESSQRFRNRIASIPCDMTMPGNALYHNNNNYNHDGSSRASSNNSLPLPVDESEFTRLRNFSVTAKGLINRGDSFRSKSRSTHSVASNNSIHCRLTSGGDHELTLPIGVGNQPVSLGLPIDQTREESVSPIAPTTSTAIVSSQPTNEPSSETIQSPEPLSEHKSYRVLVLGSSEVGKSAIIKQFTTSEYICAYDSTQEDENEKTVEVVLNGEESEMVFVEYPHADDMKPLLTSYRPDAYVVIYSVTNKRSFQQGKDILHVIQRVQEEPGDAPRAVILVGNKTDLVRLRAVSTEDGRSLAMSHDCKFIETSVGINHHVDELLVGTLAQIRLKHKLSEKRRASRSASLKEPSGQQSKSRSSSRNSSSCSGCKAKGLIKRILKKACSRSKSCDNLHVL